ncbi:ankyrin repeat protein [Talaromyces proteolyticus]|uniref:Ankyrin repeat protein n=1 Tax=Talaromyces proteolyticus TaxID=1131652 RepID=A0AAD4KIX7_9EURO|nr:ankyrin repeat protein [Talaromyces proteolyticus]KAH8693263.1 ankyrin repeat protein [Talaromyces proteolyticus]
MSHPNLYILAADNPSAVLSALQSDSSQASCQDEHGYSLLHAAASYGHIDLLRALVQEHHVNPNLTDEDGETCLFVSETLEIAKCLVEELGVDPKHANDEGLTAQETIESDGSFPEIVSYLGQITGGSTSEVAQALRDVHAPPPLPPNVSVNVGTMTEQEVDGEAGEVDSEFRRRIAELAAREDFHSEAGQNQLRALVTDAIRGVGAETQNRDVRQRTE